MKIDFNCQELSPDPKFPTLRNTSTRFFQFTLNQKVFTILVNDGSDNSLPAVQRIAFGEGYGYTHLWASPS
jgi:hypothetical protein